MTEYKNQSVDQIQKQLSNKFEKDKQWRIRDDQEIYLAGQAIINETIGKIQESGNNWGKWALEPLKNLEKELVDKHNKCEWIKPFTDNKRLLNDIAHKIDNAENIVLERLMRNNAHRDIIQKNSETKDTQGKAFFNFDKKTDTYIFTDRSNKPKIHEVLGQFFTNDKNIYTIDYSKCTNLKIKSRMQQVLGGTSSCLIKYDKKTWTYNLISNGAIVDERALIWEWVSLRTAASVAVSAKATERANNEKATDYSNQNFINSPKYQECLKNLPANLKNKLSSQQLATLISKTESRLDTIIKEQKKLWWELEQDEPISRIHFWSGLMEAHFINREGTKKDEIIWKDGMGKVEDNEKLNDQTIYNILDNNEWAYKDYLTARIKAKWAQADHLTKREQIFNGSPENKENPNLAQAVEKFSYGLDMLSQLVNKIEEEDWTSKEVAALKVAIRNYKYSLENTVPSSQELDEAKKKLGDLFVAYKSNDWSFSTMKDTTARETVANLLSGDKTNAQRSIRELGKHLNVWWNTKTTFLRDEIANNENISFGKLDYTEAFQKIGTHLEIGEKDTEAQVQEKTKLIDNLYNCANAQSIFSLLQNNGLIPANAPFDEEMKKGCQKIYDSLRAKKQAIEQLDYSPTAFKSKMEDEKIKLEAKGNNLTDDDRIRLQSISVMLENPQMLQEALQNAKSAAENSLKYEGIGALLKWSLALPFAKNGGKMSWTNADIFNRSHGLNGRLSGDETAVWLNEIGQMILEEVAICIVAIALGAVTGGVGTAAIYGARFALKAAQGARYANKAYKIKKTFTLMRKLSKARKYWKMGREAEKLVAASRQVKNLQKGAKLARTLDKSWKVAQRMKYANKLNDARRSLDAINKSNKFVHLNDLAKVWKLTDHLAKWSHLLFEGTWFHLSSTVLRNALHGKNLTDGVNPFGYTEGPNGEQISNFRGYVQSIAFLGILKAIGQPLQNLTGAALQKLMGEKIAVNTLGKALQWIASVGAEVVTLTLAEQGISLALDQEPSPITVESAIQSLGIVIGLRLYWWGSMKIKNWKEWKHWLQEITVENGEQEVVINGNGTVISSNTPNMPVGKNVLIPRMNESTWAYGKNATQEQLMRKREQLNQEITKLKNQGIASTDPKITTRENAVKFIENKLNSASYKEISLPESNKVSIKNASYNMAVNRYANWLANVNEWIPNEIQLRPDGAKIALERNGKYKDIFDQYERLLKDKPQWYEQKLQELDFMLAERVTLDTWHTVEYTAKSEAETSFKGLKKTYPESELRQFESSDGTFCIRKKLPEEVKLEVEIQTKKTMRDANNTMIQELSRKIDSLESELKTKKEKSVEEKADEISKDRPEYYEKYAKESHTDLYEQYKTYQNAPNELKRLDTEFAERLILDNPWERKILFSEKWTHWSIKERAENSFKLLSNVEKYKWNIKLVQKTLNWENVFVIELVPEIGKLTNLKNQVIAQEGIIRWKESELSKMQKKWDGLETIDESTTMFRSQESGKEVGKAETANNTNLNTKQNQIAQNMEQWEQISNENLLEAQINYQKKQIESNNKKIEALEQKKSNGEELSQNEEKQLELLKRANDALTLDIQSVNQWEGKFYNASAQVDLSFQKAQAGEIPYKDIKLDWVSKSMFEASVFLQGMKKWISTLNLQTPIEFIKKISHSLEAIKVKFGDRISIQWKKLIEFYHKQLKLIEAKKQQARELQEKQARELQENKDRNSSLERWINTERREMSEVKRNSDVIAIWDLHWEYIALKWNMEFVWLAKEVNWHLEWTGWNKKVVFQGDILGDRWTDWLRILEEISQLREQARKEWWDIDVIVGNHDDFLISYLTWWKWKRFWNTNALGVSIINGQWIWLTELLDFIWIKKTGEVEDFLNLGGKNLEIIEAMRRSPKGKQILEEICNMKIASQVDDILYIHTNPTVEILKYLTQWNIQENIKTLNQNYQWYLRKALLWQWNWVISTEQFNTISDIFLHTSNRDISWIENYVDLLKNSWINMISHGHSGWGWVFNWQRYENHQLNINWLKIVDTDYWYWKYWELDHEHSVSIVKKNNWSVEIWEHWNSYIWKHIEFHLWDKKSYSWTVKSISWVGEHIHVEVEYFDPEYGKQTINTKLSDFKKWWGYKIQV